MKTEDIYFLTSIVLYSTGHWIGASVLLFLAILITKVNR